MFDLKPKSIICGSIALFLVFYAFGIFHPAGGHPKGDIFLNPAAAQTDEPTAETVKNVTEKTNVVYFHSLTCPHCKKVKPFIKDWERKYEDTVKFTWYEINQTRVGRDMFFQFIDSYDIPRGQGGVPLAFIGDKYFLGDDPIIENMEAELEKTKGQTLILKNNLDDVIGGRAKIKNRDRSQVNLGVLLGAAAIDSINPCAIGVLVILLGFLVGIKASRRRLLTIGLTYISAVYLVYLLAGLGLLKFLAFLDIARQMQIAAGIILLIVGLILLKDSFKSDQGPTIKISDRAKPLLTRYLATATLPAAFIAGMIVSAVELPCTGEVYLGILSMLAEKTAMFQGFVYLLIYNFIFVLPLLIILLLAFFGLRLEKIEQFHKQKSRSSRLIIGLLMIGLAIWLFLA